MHLEPETFRVLPPRYPATVRCGKLRSVDPFLGDRSFDSAVSGEIGLFGFLRTDRSCPIPAAPAAHRAFDAAGARTGVQKPPDQDHLHMTTLRFVCGRCAHTLIRPVQNADIVQAMSEATGLGIGCSCGSSGYRVGFAFTREGGEPQRVELVAGADLLAIALRSDILVLI